MSLRIKLRKQTNASPYTRFVRVKEFAPLWCLQEINLKKKTSIKMINILSRKDFT